MVIPVYTPTRKPFEYRYSFPFPPPSLTLHIVETSDIATAKGYRAVLLVPGREDMSWTETAIQRIREITHDLVYIGIVIPPEALKEAEKEAKRLRVAIWRLNFKERAKVYECFWTCACFCRKDFTWERRKWPLFARFSLKRLSFV